MSDKDFHALAKIDLEKLNYNIERICSITNKEIYPVIKCNGYGHGLLVIGSFLSKIEKVSKLSVWTAAEALSLRKTAIEKPIILLGGVSLTNASLIRDFKLEPVISSIDELKLLESKISREKVSIHIKLNTGMNRLGADYEEAIDLYDLASKSKNIKIAALMTHLFSSKKDDIDRQLDKFEDFISVIRSKGGKIEKMHAASSGAVFVSKRSYYDAVRAGISIYGISPFMDAQMDEEAIKIKPILSLYAKIVKIRDLKKNETVSYSGRYKADMRRKIALVSIGYGDGYPRLLSNKAKAILNGRFINQIGTICMDVSMFDITDIENAKPGDLVTMIGQESDGKKVTATMLASMVDSIPYEIVTRLGDRILKEYKGV